MRIANRNSRANIVTEEGFVDIARASQGRFSSSLREVVQDLGELSAWWAEAQVPIDRVTGPLDRDPGLGPVISDPRQIFAIGLNYHDHAKEMGLMVPTSPLVFTKFASSLGASGSLIARVSPQTDWEAELVVVIGRGGRDISTEEALSHVAGYCVGQDFSDRELLAASTPAQFSLGKSWKNFSPTGPWLTTADEIRSPQALAIGCSVNGLVMQDSTTAEMIFGVAEVVAYLSKVIEFYPGDLIFTGSPRGVGKGQVPPWFLQEGDQVETWIEGLGSIVNFVSATT